MKLFLILFLALSLAGCSSATETPQPTPTPTATPTATATPETSVGAEGVEGTEGVERVEGEEVGTSTPTATEDEEAPLVYERDEAYYALSIDERNAITERASAANMVDKDGTPINVPVYSNSISLWGWITLEGPEEAPHAKEAAEAGYNQTGTRRDESGTIIIETPDGDVSTADWTIGDHRAAGYGANTALGEASGSEVGICEIIEMADPNPVLDPEAVKLADELYGS